MYCFNEKSPEKALAAGGSSSKLADPSVPPIIWQTYKTRDIPRRARDCVESWRLHHPGWRLRLIDDEEMDSFIAHHFDRTVRDVYRALPLTVMRTDLWRYAVIYEYGGLYADLDTLCCHPAERWLEKGKHLFIGLLSHQHFVQYVFAASPRHRALEKVIDLIVARARRGFIQEQRVDFVFHHTGPGVWSDALCDYLAEQQPVAEDNGPPLGRGRLCPGTTFAQYRMWGQSDVKIMPAHAFRSTFVRHLVASKNWGGQEGYVSWTKT